MMTAPELRDAAGGRIHLMPDFDHAAVQANTATQIVEARLRHGGDPRLPLQAGEENELLELIEERVDQSEFDAPATPRR